MNHDLNIAVLQKMISAYPDAADWISERSDQIFERRIKQIQREAFDRGVDTALSPLTMRFWKSTFEGMGRILDDVAHILGGSPPPRQTIPPRADDSWKAVESSLNWAIENFHLAACDYIREHDVPMDIFTPEEQAYIRGSSEASPETNQRPEATR